MSRLKDKVVAFRLSQEDFSHFEEKLLTSQMTKSAFFREVFLQSNVSLTVQSAASSDLSAIRYRRRYTDLDWFTCIPGVPSLTESIERAGYRIREEMEGGTAGSLTLQPYALNPHTVATLAQIQQRGDLLFHQKNRQKNRLSFPWFVG